VLKRALAKLMIKLCGAGGDADAAQYSRPACAEILFRFSWSWRPLCSSILFMISFANARAALLKIKTFPLCWQPCASFMIALSECCAVMHACWIRQLSAIDNVSASDDDESAATVMVKGGKKLWV
jgi:hypothetical protein